MYNNLDAATNGCSPKTAIMAFWGDRGGLML